MAEHLNKRIWLVDSHESAINRQTMRPGQWAVVVVAALAVAVAVKIAVVVFMTMVVVVATYWRR